MIATIIALSAFIYILIALRVQAETVIEPNIMESIAIIFWPILLIMGVSRAFVERIKKRVADRRENKIKKQSAAQ